MMSLGDVRALGSVPSNIGPAKILRRQHLCIAVTFAQSTSITMNGSLAITTFAAMCGVASGYAHRFVRKGDRGAVARRFGPSAQDLWLLAGAASGDYRKREATLEVSKVMSVNGWPAADPASFEAEELRGGSNYTEIVIAVRSPDMNVKPDRVVYKCYAPDALRNMRMLEASKSYAAVGAAPRQFIAEDNMVIEEFAGDANVAADDDVASLEKSCESVASMSAKLHTASINWFEPWRREMETQFPALRLVPTDSSLWPVVAYTGAMKLTDSQTESLISLLPKPASEAGRRVVCVHGDLHDANILVGPDGSLLACDFEFTSASNAAQDLMYKAASIDGSLRRRLCTQYLKEIGAPHGEEEVELLAFDACVAAVIHFGVLRRILCSNKIATCGLPIMPIEDALESLRKLDLAGAVQVASSDPERRRRVIDSAEIRGFIADLPGFALLLDRQNSNYK